MNGEQAMGFVRCRRGCRHWGRHGAAGLLVRCDEHVLLQLRGAGQFTNTWSVPGGAIERNEEPLTAAMREAREEVLGLPDDLRISTDPLVNNHGGWAYRTYLAECERRTNVSARDWESREIAWVHCAEVGRLRLHPGFRSTWGQLQGRIAA